VTVVVRRRILTHRGRLTRKRAEAHVRRRILNIWQWYVLTYAHVGRSELTYGSGSDTYVCANARAQRHMRAVREQIISVDNTFCLLRKRIRAEVRRSCVLSKVLGQHCHM
jgi:hypothetical protein